MLVLLDLSTPSTAYLIQSNLLYITEGILDEDWTVDGFATLVPLLGRCCVYQFTANIRPDCRGWRGGMRDGNRRAS
jgi:hypothetical protein